MRGPHLNRQLTLETPQRTPDGAGGYVENWGPVGVLWAAMSARNGRERREGLAAVAAVAYRVIVRAAPVGAASRPRPEQRFRDGNRVFRISAVAEWDPAGRYLVCFADEEVAS